MASSTQAAGRIKRRGTIGGRRPPVPVIITPVVCYCAIVHCTAVQGAISGAPASIRRSCRSFSAPLSKFLGPATMRGF